MQERNKELIGANGDRQLWRLEILQPNGQWDKVYQGKVFMNVQGVRKQTPDDPAFIGQAEAQAWLLQV
ncbi:MAG: hypothetical protein EOS55_25530 [Mesorhizobium sp.]|nr:MAG: hypothetical protein EOS55_25530 [Mesorhizobium sp.]